MLVKDRISQQCFSFVQEVPKKATRRAGEEMSDLFGFVDLDFFESFFFTFTSLFGSCMSYAKLIVLFFNLLVVLESSIQ